MPTPRLPLNEDQTAELSRLLRQLDGPLREEHAQLIREIEEMMNRVHLLPVGPFQAEIHDETTGDILLWPENSTHTKRLKKGTLAWKIHLARRDANVTLTIPVPSE